MQEMMAIMGCSYEDMQGVLKSLGFQSETIKLEDLPPQLQTPETKTPETETAEPNPEVAAEPVADVVTPAETETSKHLSPPGNPRRRYVQRYCQYRVLVYAAQKASL